MGYKVGDKVLVFANSEIQFTGIILEITLHNLEVLWYRVSHPTYGFYNIYKEDLQPLTKLQEVVYDT